MVRCMYPAFNEGEEGWRKPIDVYLQKVK